MLKGIEVLYWYSATAWKLLRSVRTQDRGQLTAQALIYKTTQRLQQIMKIYSECTSFCHTKYP